MDWIAGTLSLCALLCVARRKRIGFLIFAVADVFWIITSIDRQVYGLLMLEVPTIFINIWAFRRWRK